MNGVFGTICVGMFAEHGRVASMTGGAGKWNGLFYGGGFDQLIGQLVGVGAGAGLSIPHVEVTTLPWSIVGESKTFEYQIAGGVVQALAGLSYEFADNWRLFGEYKLSYSWNKAQLSGDVGTFETNLVTHHVLAGVSYAFDVGGY